jgi:hypothetical protein
MKKFIERIEKIKSTYKKAINPPATDGQINDFKEKFSTAYGLNAPNGYLIFLKHADGLSFNGYRIYGTSNKTSNGEQQGFFEINESWHNTLPDIDINEDYILFADSGLDKFIMRISNRSFYSVDRVSDEVVETFASAEAMIEYILNLMLNT